MKITEAVLSLADSEYKKFHSRLMPTVNPDKIIGVRTPHLRRLAKELRGSREAEEFLRNLPHKYYEEDNLHAFLIENIKDFESCISALNKFLPFVDNWATCDCMRPKILKSEPQKLLKQIKAWLKSEHTYTVRFAIGTLLSYYLDGEFMPEYLELVASVQSEEYYIRMMKAWYFATALAKQYQTALPYITEQKMDGWTHNKTIQKAVESYRLTDEQKTYLKKFRL